MKERKSVKKERKSVKPGTDPQFERAAWVEQKPLRPEATRNMEVQAKRTRGRLSREDQRRLGDILHRVYDEVVKEGVPDRFEKLLLQLNDARGAPQRQAESGTASDASCSSEPEEGGRAKGKPQDEGSD
jgi:Anti-sigma factor NepR